jgi:hypothetical protein
LLEDTKTVCQKLISGDRKTIPHGVQGQPKVLVPWVLEAQASGIPALKEFAVGLERELSDIKAAFSLEWSKREQPVSDPAREVRFGIKKVPSVEQERAGGGRGEQDQAGQASDVREGLIRPVATAGVTGDVTKLCIKSQTEPELHTPSLPEA